MDPRMDFLNRLEPDMSVKILTCFGDPSELVRFTSVSRSWRDFVIENSLCKKLCKRLFPQLSSIACEVNKPDAMKLGDVGPSSSKEFETMELEREHRAYALLAHRLTSFNPGNAIGKAISASSTDNYPEESIRNTLHARELRNGRASYWSSKGQHDPAVPERLIYKLISDFVIITEINIKPFKAFFQTNKPIYSANAVRFRMGHSKSPVEMSDPTLEGESCHDDKFIWTYTSQVFPMTQESRLQNFKLPEPVLCIGGFLQIELMGRVQRQEMDDLFYICVSHVQAKGKSLAPAFGVEVQASGKVLLMANLDASGSIEPNSPENDSDLTTADAEGHMRQMMPLVPLLHGHVVDFEEELDWDDDEDGSDEEFAI